MAGFLDALAAGADVALRTSGSAGVPRLVVRTTSSWTSSFPAFSELTGLTAGSRVWVPGPLSATMNLFAAVHAAVVGAAVVPGLATATHAALTPTALRRLLDEGAPLSGVTVVVAGDALPTGLHDRATAAGATVHHYYGAAELSFVAWGGHAADLRPFPGVELAVRDGEVWARSPYVCTGYVGAPGPLRRSTDGFATVGDRGRLVDGRLEVAGRPDAVSVGGATVPVADVEALLRPAAHGDVAVVGMTHPELGSVLAAVLTDVDDLAPLRRLARDRLAGAHRPRRWFHLHRLPVTPAGKVDREALVSMLSGPDAGVRPMA